MRRHVRAVVAWSLFDNARTGNKCSLCVLVLKESLRCDETKHLTRFYENTKRKRIIRKSPLNLFLRTKKRNQKKFLVKCRMKNCQNWKTERLEAVENLDGRNIKTLFN